MGPRLLAPLLALVALSAAVLTALPASGRPLPGAKKCAVFPADNPWNQRVDGLPTASNSSAIVNRIGAGDTAHADFGSGLYNGGPIGIPYKTVSSKQKRLKVSFDYADESDRVRYPIPKNVPIEGGKNSSGDRHVILVDRDKCKLYELYDARPVKGGKRWHAGSGAVWSLKSNKLRPAGFTSADAAGLPILPGLARYDEVKAGEIDHALRFTVQETRKGYVYPARHQASDATDPDLPPMGIRFRLKKSFDTSRFPPQTRIVLEALKRYGMIVADNGTNWYVSGAPSKGWNNDDLHSFGQIMGSDFEVVDTSSLPTPGL
jgi:hypothetical protein